MKVIIDNVSFPFEIGCRLLKLKYDKFPSELFGDITSGQFVFYTDRGKIELDWDNIEPLTFKEIALLKNLEQRRVGIVSLGLDRLVKEVNPELVDTQTIHKTTMWVNDNGDIDLTEFDDTYKLYKVNGDYFNEFQNSWSRTNAVYYISCKDTSTDREYLIWVDIHSVNATNRSDELDTANAIDCIAWTIQTNIPQGNIEKIVRQGDCILIKPKGKYNELSSPRHLTASEYKELLVAES